MALIRREHIENGRLQRSLGVRDSALRLERLGENRGNLLARFACLSGLPRVFDDRSNEVQIRLDGRVKPLLEIADRRDLILCQLERSASAIAQAMGFEPQVVANAAESSIEHHLGMTCDPVAGFVQVPCIERCAYGAVKAWTGTSIASNEIPTNRRVDFDTTVAALALTAKEMNSKYKETSEGGLAVCVTLC